MGKKTVLIAVQTIQRKKGFITSSDNGIGVDLVVGSFKIIPSKNG